MKRIYLIGYMGAGKTTLGKAFAHAMGLTFIDLDWFIEERHHQTIRQLFDQYGEQGFREIERKVLHEASEFENVVISAGGGTPCFFDNMEFMNQTGQTVFLQASHEVLFQRLKVARRQRPLLANKSDEELKDFIAEGLSKRAPFYTKARYVLSGDELESKSQIQGTIEKLKELLNLEAE